jgi:hypothetical protein
MRLQTVPAAQGFAWFRRGFQAYFKRPLGYTLLLGSALFAMLLALLIPVAGVVLLLMGLPLVSLGFMAATRLGLAGQAAGPGVFADGLKGPPPRPRTMGLLLGLYAASSILAMLLGDAIDGGRLAALQAAMTGDTAADAAKVTELVTDPRLQTGMLVRLVLTAALAVPFWHAPALVRWEGQGLGQSLFISTVACWRNKGAFTVFALAWTALLLLFSVVANTVSVLAGEPRLVALAVMPAALMFSTAFYTSLYFIYADSFVPDAPAPAELPPAVAAD